MKRPIGWLAVVILIATTVSGLSLTSTTVAEEVNSPNTPAVAGSSAADAPVSSIPALEPNQTVGADDIQAIMAAEANDDASQTSEPSGIDMLTLLVSGGRFMIPIGLMSLLVVALAAERMLSLRRGKVFPKPLVRELESLADPIERFDPSKAYLTCLNNPSPTASVIGAMLLRTGQPLGEIERAASETLSREADRYASPVRWLSLAAAATPLMGLLGTVWGMIVAFHESTSLSAERSRSEQLSEGIYTALVTTLAGLIVAIPAAILAQYLENRIAALFHKIEQFAFDLAPGLAKFTGKQRMAADGTLIAISEVDAEVSAKRGKGVTPPPPHATVRGDDDAGQSFKAG
ncbi:MotA/TolQ/ExbB proton channel family protein [Stieleria sp. JC731]|uniref:MotA/TolQ/ExbB proton channel family protein n=1 Tax=Pirellulaceae TaxID=2691357 RepID=UPI001E353EA7|nr:MotA/TolQ/ExbB proton channel family protein [Stieleria sp. JC731]MCC9599677.1 MotA/TolQ/ExbB proton channel family protein [Stieleria sp. JC731]